MKMLKSKKQIKSKLSTIGATITLFVIKSNISLANDSSTGIGTAQVKTATENIERVITSIAMPLGRYFNFRKYCYSST